MSYRRFSTSLVTRLVVFGVLLVIFGGAVRYFLHARFLREDMTQLVSAQQTALAEAVAKAVDEKIRIRKRFLEQLSHTLPEELLGRPAALEAWLAERYRLNPVFSLGLLVADKRGMVLADFPNVEGRRRAVLADNPDFLRALAAQGGDAVIGTPRVGPYTKKPMLPMGVPLRNARGELQAVLIGITGLDAPEFLESVSHGKIGETGSYLLISPADHLFVASGDARMMLQPTPLLDINPLHDRAMLGYRGSGVTVNAAGVEELSSMVSVPSTGWFVVARLPTEEAFAAVRNSQMNIVKHTLTVTLIVIVVAGFFVRRMLRPLRNAAKLAERMTQGEIPLAPLPVVRDDEVGHLTAAFNRLLDKLLRSQAQLKHMAHHDALTGLPNRAMLADRMQQGLARAQRNHSRIAILFLDLDGFKPINDELGHDAGDAALIEIARRLSGIVRQMDTVGRIGGDEFVLLATDLPEKGNEGVAALAQKCIDALSKPMMLGNESRMVGVSIGIAVSAGGHDPEVILQAADQAMYQAKKQGKGCYVFSEDLPAGKSAEFSGRP